MNQPPLPALAPYLAQDGEAEGGFDWAVTEEGHAKIKRRMAIVDAMAPDVRQCVHDFGFTIVHSFVEAGVTKARVIRHLINTVASGSWEMGVRKKTQDMEIEMQKRQAGRFRKLGYLVVPEMPTPAMVDASIEALKTTGLAGTQIDRARKHTVRLMEANLAAHAEAFGKV